ncbi:MAG: hypothetical protein ACRDZX_07075 [Acidimicrobiales bacterium]
MKLNRKRLAVLTAVAALAAAGGAAYTTSNLNGALVDGYQVAGYGALTVSGATLVSLDYTLDGNDPPSVTALTFVTSGDTHNAAGYIGFNGTSTLGASCTGTYSSGTSTTTYSSCALPGATAELVTAITSTDIVVAPTS